MNTEEERHRVHSSRHHQRGQEEHRRHRHSSHSSSHHRGHKHHGEPTYRIRRHRRHRRRHEDDEFKNVEAEYEQERQRENRNREERQKEQVNTLRPFHAYAHKTYRAGKYSFNLYECLRPTGEILGYGAFAVVIRVEDARWNEKRMLAVKQNFNAFQTVADARKLLRELLILKHFTDHPHDSLMGLHGVIVPPETERYTFDSICLVMSQQESNLGRVFQTKMVLAAPHIASIVFQILAGVRALHAAGIIHRDLKPDNILINSNCKIKVTDYNMSREIPEEDDGVLMSDVVVARWYRAPEIVLTQGHYTEKIDLWSVGCIMGEFYLQSPLFETASNSLELVRLSMQLLGTPRGDLSWITRVEESGFSYREYVAQTNYDAQDLSIIFPRASDVEVQVLANLLSINPDTRLSAAEAMRLPFFSGQKFRRGGKERFVMKPYVKRIMFGDVSVEELRDVMYDVLCNFNRDVLSDGDRRERGEQSASAGAAEPTSVRAHRSTRPTMTP